MKILGYAGELIRLSIIMIAVAFVGRSVGQSAPGEVKWHVPMVGVMRAGPTLGTNGLVYGVNQPGETTYLYAWEAVSGQLRWATNVGPYALDGYGALVVGPEGHVYVKTSSGARAFDGETGQPLWSSDAPGAIAVGSDGTVYVALTELIALNPTTGARRWSTGFVRPDDYGAPVIMANGLVLVLGPQSIVAVDGRNGGEVWRFSDPGRLISLSSVAAGADGTVFVGGRSGELYAIDGATGKKRWNLYGPGEASDLIVAPDGSLCVGQNEVIEVRDSASGVVQRRIRLRYAQQPRLAMTADETLYVAFYELASGGNHLLALNYATGETNWALAGRFRLRGLNVGSDGTVYIERDGMHALHGISPLADTAWPKAMQNGQNSSCWKVSGTPHLTRQPETHWAAVERSTAFHIYTPVMRPLHVQWFFNGQPIAGATNDSLTIENVRFVDAGRYSVVLSNRFGTVVSDDAILSVGYALDVTVVGPGRVERAPELEVYPTNSLVELRALAGRSNHTFVGWSGAVEETTNRIITTLSNNTEVTATFVYLHPDVKWSASFGDAPALGVNGILYAHAGYAVVAVDMATGSNVWEHVSGDGWWAPPAVARDGTVYIGDYGGSSIFAFDGTTGERRGGFSVGVCVHSCPTIGVDGTLYLAGLQIFAVEPGTHRERWSFQGGDRFESSPALSADGVLYAGCYDGKMYALNSRTGAKLWEFATGGEVHSSPAIAADGTVYFGSADARLYALDGRTGEKKWDFASRGVISGSPVIGPDGSIYFGSEDNLVYALDATGETKWYYVTGGRITATPALTADGTLYIGSQTGLYAFNCETGAMLWRLGGGSATPAIGPDGTIYYGGAALYGTSPLAVSSWPKFHGHADNRGRVPAKPLFDGTASRMTAAGYESILHGEPGENLTVEWSADFLSWTDLGTFSNPDGSVDLRDTNAPNGVKRYYRARVAP